MHIANRLIRQTICDRVRLDFLLDNRCVGKNIVIENTPIPIIVPPKGTLAPASNTVSPALLFGLAAYPGMFQAYSRGDHTHGTPTLYVDSVTIQGTGNQDDPLHTIAVQNDYMTHFLFSTWVGPSMGFYSIAVNHGLSENLVEVEVWDGGNNPVDIERNILSGNLVQLLVPADPDLRFSGLVWIKKT